MMGYCNILQVYAMDCYDWFCWFTPSVLPSKARPVYLPIIHLITCGSSSPLEPTCFLCFTDCWVSMALLLQEVYHIIARINLKDSSCCAACQSFPPLLDCLLMFVVWWPPKSACISRSISPKYRAIQPARVYHCVLIQLSIELEHPCKSSWIFQRLRVPKNIHHCRSCSWCFPFLFYSNIM
jgi:hypothetical protein